MINQASVVSAGKSIARRQRLTTILTTTITDSLPFGATSQTQLGQVSHGIPQPGQIWHVRGVRAENLVRVMRPGDIR